LKQRLETLRKSQEYVDREDHDVEERFDRDVDMRNMRDMRDDREDRQIRSPKRRERRETSNPYFNIAIICLVMFALVMSYKFMKKK